MVNKYGIVRLDRMSGTPDGRLKAAVDIQNGMFVVPDEVDGVLRLATDRTASVRLVASVAHQFESFNEGDFINKADDNLKPRTYQLEEDDIFTITEQVIGFQDESTPLGVRASFADIQVGDYGQVSQVAADAGKLCFLADASDDAKLVVQVIGKTKLNRDNAVQVKVVKN
jgi:hypothetical protein